MKYFFIIRFYLKQAKKIAYWQGYRIELVTQCLFKHPYWSICHKKIDFAEHLALAKLNVSKKSVRRRRIRTSSVLAGLIFFPFISMNRVISLVWSAGPTLLKRGKYMNIFSRTWTFAPNLHQTPVNWSYDMSCLSSMGKVHNQSEKTQISLLNN